MKKAFFTFYAIIVVAILSSCSSTENKFVQKVQKTFNGEEPGVEEFVILKAGFYGNMGPSLSISVIIDGKLKSFEAEEVKIDPTIEEIEGSVALIKYNGSKPELIEIKKYLQVER